MRLFSYEKALAASLIVASAAFVLVSCDGISSGTGDAAGSYDEPLEITGVQYQDADSVDASGNPLRPDTLAPGDRIALEGQNMNSVAQVSFLGFEASHNGALASEDNLIVSIPGDLPFGELDVAALDSLDAIHVENQSSEAAYNDVPVLPGDPELNGISNEYADPGEEVTITGNALYLVESVTFPDGTTVSGEEVEATTDGEEAVFTVPSGVTKEEGPVVYTTSGGTGESSPSFLFHDTRGMLLNMDDYTSWGGWSAMASGDAGSELRADFDPGAEGGYLIMKGDGEIPGSNTEWWTGNRTIQLNDQQWAAPENLDEGPENFVVKFELNVRQEWEAGSVQLYLLNTASPENYGTGYAYRLQPWLQSDGSVSTVSWEGWRTISIPLSDFTDAAGSKDGATPSNLGELLEEDGTVGSGGPDGNPTAFRLVNYSERVMPADQAFAIDNLRVVPVAGAN